MSGQVSLLSNSTLQQYIGKTRNVLKADYPTTPIYDAIYDGEIQIFGPVIIIQTNNSTKLIEDISYNPNGN